LEARRAENIFSLSSTPISHTQKKKAPGFVDLFFKEVTSQGSQILPTFSEPSQCSHITHRNQQQKKIMSEAATAPAPVPAPASAPASRATPPATTATPPLTMTTQTTTTPTGPHNDKESPLSPHAPVFFPKWKFASSPSTTRKGFTHHQNSNDDDNDNDNTPSTFNKFSKDLGRSLSGGFQQQHLRSQQPPQQQQMSSPSANRRQNTGGSSKGGAQSPNTPTSNTPTSSPALPSRSNTNSSPAIPTTSARVASPRFNLRGAWREQQQQQESISSPPPATTQQHQQQMQQLQHQQQMQQHDEAKGNTSKAITVEHRMVKPGEYSTWIRVLSADVGPPQLAAVLARCEESNNKGTIHVYLREKFINRQLIQQLKSQRYKFHHFVEETQTFVYGKKTGPPSGPDDEDRELVNATAREMVGVLLLSPDEKSVLLVWDMGKWGCLNGSLVTRESVIDGVRREVRSQLSMEVDKTYPSRVVGGWSKAAAKFDCINELLVCFVVKATGTSFDVDEGMHVQWFLIDELMQLLDMVDSQFKQLGVEPKLDSAIECSPGHVFSHTALRWLRTYKVGHTWNTTAVAERHVFCCT